MKLYKIEYFRNSHKNSVYLPKNKKIRKNHIYIKCGLGSVSNDDLSIIVINGEKRIKSFLKLKI